MPASTSSDWWMAHTGPSAITVSSLSVTTVAISMTRSLSGLSPVISRSIQIKLSLRFTSASGVRLAQCAGERPAAEHVQVNVEDDLAAFAPDVHCDAIARQRRVGGDAFRRQQQRPDQVLVTGTEVV